MGKIDFNSMKRQREEREAEVASCTPEALEQSYTNVWGSDKEKVEQIELARLHPFKDAKSRTQPFRISKEKVAQIKLSASDIGIVTPLIVRKHGKDYQIISGHHRLIAAKELKMLTVPCVVRNIRDDEVVKYVAECNIQRSKLMPTEYAEIYARYMELRSDIDMTAQEIADKFGISKKSLYRYIKILDLTDNLRGLIDNDMLHTDTAEIFSEFSSENQESVYEYVQQSGKKINRAIAKEMEAIVRNCEGGFITANEFAELLDKPKKNCKNKIYNGFAKKYKVDYTEDEWNNLISNLLEKHFNEK